MIHIIKNIYIMTTNTSTIMTAEQSLTARRLVGELRQVEKSREAYYQVVQDKSFNS